MEILISSLFASVLFVTACYSDDPQPVYAADGDVDDNADLVEVSPGVEVIADYDEPIFFSDDYYWVNRGGVWYQSTWYRGGWVRAGVVPGHISVIAHPEGYAHYRPAGYVAHTTIRGGYANHAQYHATHVSGGVHVRAAVRSGGGHHR